MSTTIRKHPQYQLTRYARGRGKLGLQITPTNGSYAQLTEDECRDLGQFLIDFAKDPMKRGEAHDESAQPSD